MNTVIHRHFYSNKASSRRLEVRIKDLPWVFGERKPSRQWSLSRQEIQYMSNKDFYILTKGRK